MWAKSGRLGWTRRLSGGDRSGAEGDEAFGGAGGAFETGEVALHFEVGLEGAEGSVKDGSGAVISRMENAVVHPLALAAGADDAGVAQIGEVAGDLGLALAEDLDELADADFAVVHEVEQAEASAVGEGREEAGQVEGR